MKILTGSELGLVLRERRRELGLTQAEFADRIGVSRQWVGRVEKGLQHADLGLALRAIRALGLVVDVRSEGDSAASGTRTDGSDIDAVIRAARRGTS